MAQRYYNDFKEKVRYNKINDLYEILDDEMKNTIFMNINDLEKYLKNINTNIDEISLEKWEKKVYKEYTQYICLDTTGRYYIFNETSPMQYKLIIGKYSVDLPEFVEKYNSTNEQGKVALNIQKFVQSINDKNYRYAYNCLSDGFKNNYFKNQQSFENYIEQNLYESNEINYIEFETQGELYTYKIQFTEKENHNSQIIEKIFIMKLGEGTDFELSFNIE